MAEVANSALRAAGIQATISAEDTGYDITLASGGAKLLVEADSLKAAKDILAVADAEGDDLATSRPIRFRLRMLFALTTLVAFASAGYAYNGLSAAIGIFQFVISVFIGVVILLSLGGRRPFKKFFAAMAGLGFLLFGVFSLVMGLLE